MSKQQAEAIIQDAATDLLAEAANGVQFEDIAAIRQLAAGNVEAILDVDASTKRFFAACIAIEMA